MLRNDFQLRPHVFIYGSPAVQVWIIYWHHRCNNIYSNMEERKLTVTIEPFILDDNNSIDLCKFHQQRPTLINSLINVVNCWDN